MRAACGELTRATLVRFLLQIGEEYGHFLRHRGGFSLAAGQYRLLRDIEAHLHLELALDSLEPTWIEDENREAFAGDFKQATGLTPDEYLMRRRLDHAAHRLLTTEQRTGIIAEALGFADLADLTRHFEARYRISPAVYRQKFAPPPPSARRRAAASRRSTGDDREKAAPKDADPGVVVE
jgi:AraC-like DNA-binding protein